MAAGEIKTAELAKMVGITVQALGQHEQRKIIKKSRRGFYPHPQAIQSLFGHYREQAAGRAGSSLTQARTDLANAQKDAVELKNAITRGEYLLATEVEAEWSDVLSSIRARMLALASDIAQLLPHLSKHDILAIDSAIRDALHEAADALGADGGEAEGK